MHIFVSVRLVNHDQVKLGVDDLVFDDLKPIVINDDKVGIAMDGLDSFFFRVAVGNSARAVHCKLEEVCFPCRLHD